MAIIQTRSGGSGDDKKIIIKRSKQRLGGVRSGLGG